MEKEMFGTHKNVRDRKLTSTNSINKIALENDCPIAYTISVIGGRWKLSILALLADRGPLRYSELKTRLGGISERMLTLQLKQLEQCGLISKKIFGEIPPRTEYQLSERGQSLQPILEQMTKWGEVHRMF
jgi:DNA-binding HxlR family transcriptional regulator